LDDEHPLPKLRGDGGIAGVDVDGGIGVSILLGECFADDGARDEKDEEENGGGGGDDGDLHGFGFVTLLGS